MKKQKKTKWTKKENKEMKEMHGAMIKFVCETLEILADGLKTSEGLSMKQREVIYDRFMSSYMSKPESIVDMYQRLTALSDNAELRLN